MNKNILKMICAGMIGTAVSLASANEKKVCNDFDGDGRTDPAIYYTSSGTWLILQTSNFQVRTEQLGGGNFRPAPGDFDGDAKTDLVVFDTTTAIWQAKLSGGGEGAACFGSPGMWPVPGDYDGDRKTDLGVYNPQTGYWTVLLSKTLATGSMQWGHLGDFRSWENPQCYTVLPMPFDYNQDGVDDLAYYYRGLSMADSGWTILYVGVGSAAYIWGSSGSLPAPGVYNYTNAELGQRWAQGVCIYKVKTAEWSIPYRNPFYVGTYGSTLPIAAGDYDGNGYDDNAVYDYNSGLWTVVFNTGPVEVDGRVMVQVTFGGAGAVPANLYSTIYALARYTPKPW